MRDIVATSSQSLWFAKVAKNLLMLSNPLKTEFYPPHWCSNLGCRRSRLVTYFGRDSHISSVRIAPNLLLCTSLYSFVYLYHSFSIFSLNDISFTSCFCSSIPGYCESRNLTYDYIIVGAGTSGLVIANRLSELNVIVAVCYSNFLVLETLPY